MCRRRWLPLLGLVTACGGRDGNPGAPRDAGAGDPAAAATPSLPLAVLPIDPDASELPIVRGSINGRPARLLIDTGASASIVSATFIGAPPDSSARVETLCLGTICLAQLGVWAADTPFSSARPDGVQAVVGMNPLSRWALELDQGRTLTLWQAAPSCPGAPLPFTLDDEGRPLVPAWLDDRPLGPILLDTGARYSLLDASTAAEADYLDDAAVETGACSIHGCSSGGSYLAAARRLCAGERCLSDVEVKYPAWNAIGGSFLRRVRMIADLPGRTVTFCE